MWSILPSYSMYQSTFYGELDAPQYGEPSSFEGEQRSLTNESSELATQATQATSATTVESNTNSVQHSDSTTPTSLESFIVADESTTTWRETILDNIHNLRNLTFTDNKIARSVDIKIHFTEDAGEVGKKPTYVDPLLFEYKQGDFINGYFLIENTGDTQIPFDMFYVLFEGTFIVTGKKEGTTTKQPVKIKKFLEMFDFAASWNDSFVNRLTSDEIMESYTCPFVFDQTDKSHLAMRYKRLEPGRRYKRFFTFKIPEKLLDSECHDHNLAGHTELPPTMGLSERERAEWSGRFVPVNDFSFVNTCTNYGVLARFIGKASKYNVGDEKERGTKLINASGDEFIILKDHCSYVRVVQESNILSESQKAVNNEATRVLYENFVRRVQEKIAIGKELKRAIQDCNDTEVLDISTRLAAEQSVLARSHDQNIKARQLYTRFDGASKNKTPCCKPKTYDIIAPLTKRSPFGSSKIQGTIKVSTPKTEYILNYINPSRFRAGESLDSNVWKLQVPIEISFTPSTLLKGGKAPEIAGITAELVVFTVKSNKRPVPVELNHDFLFTNECSLVEDFVLKDTFTGLVKNPMKKYAKELYDLVTELGPENFRVEKSLVEDLSAMSNLEEKYNNLTLNKPEVLLSNGKSFEFKKGQKLPVEEADSNARKFSLVVDVSKARKKVPNPPAVREDYRSYNDFCLVPSFQTCLFSRMYYLRVLVTFSTSDVVELKVPVTIAKVPTN